MVVDAWMQHPTPRLFRHAMFASLLRWTGQEPPAEEIPLAVTLAAMDAGGVDFGLVSAWHGPRRRPDLQRRGRRLGRRAPRPARGPGVGRPARPGPRRARAAPLRRPSWASRACGSSRGCGAAAERPPLLPAVRRVRGARRAVLHPGRPHRAAAQLRDRPPDPLPRRRRARLPRPDDRRRAHRLPVDGGDGRARAQVPQRATSTPPPTPSRRYPPELVRYLRGRRAQARSCSAPTGR